MRYIILSLLFVLSLTACDNKQEQPLKNEKTTIKIGASFPLTGNMAGIGNAGYKALQASINDANKNSKNKFNYELIVENDQMDPKQISAIANKLLYVDKVDAIVSYFSVAGRIVAPLAAKNKIINFTCGFGNDVLQSKYNFQNFLTIEAENEAIVQFLKKNKISKVDLIYQNVGAGQEFLAHLVKTLDDNAISYTVQNFNKGERDYNILVSKCKNRNSQAILIYAFEPEADILTNELKRQNVNKILIYNDSIPMANNYTMYEGSYNIGSKATSEMQKEAWGLKEQNAAYSIYLYDIGSQIIYGFEQASKDGEKPTANQVSDTLLSKTRYHGVVGDYTLDKKGQFHSKAEISIVKNGQLVVIEN